MSESDLDRLSSEQRQVLQIVLDFYRAERQWPNYRWLNQFLFVQHSIELDPLFATLPPGYVLPDPSTQFSISHNNPVSLTLRGVLALAGERELDYLLRTLHYLGDRAARFMPPPDGQTQDLTVTSSEVARAIDCAEDDPALLLVRDLVTNSIWEIWAGSGVTPEGVWNLTLIPEKARAYREVNSLEDLLRIREPLEQQRLAWSRPTRPPPSIQESTEAHEPDAREPVTEYEPDHRKTVFVVYGRNELARQAMFDFLLAVGLEPLDWDKLLAATGEASPYVGEVLAAGFPMAHAVVVLLTPDDVAQLRTTFLHERDPHYERELTPQARPNVLFEAGMAFSSHPARTILVELGDLRPFSDVAGRHTLRMNDSVESRRSLISRLRTAGCHVTPSDEAWKTAGDFGSALAIAAGERDSREGDDLGGRIARFALVPQHVTSSLDAGPVTLEVHNAGATDEFEATVVALSGSADARPPWYVRWRNSTDRIQEILTDHNWVLEVCEDDALAGHNSTRWMPGWRFFSPDSDRLIVPDNLGSAHLRYGTVIRATVRVTPRSDPGAALEDTVTISLNDSGRAVGWDSYRVE